MDKKEAVKVFNNYRDHVNNGSKITIHYDGVKTLVEAYEVLEAHIKKDLSLEAANKQFNKNVPEEFTGFLDRIAYKELWIKCLKVNKLLK